jgi:hypothetical protein
MARVYSRRFLAAVGPTLIWAYQVPAGYRAVVRSILSTNDGATGGAVWVALAGRFAWRAAYPAAVGNHAVETYQVVYGGENIEAYVEAAGSSVLVSGFIFEDPTGPLGPSAEVRVAHEVTPLPNELERR